MLIGVNELDLDNETDGRPPYAVPTLAIQAIYTHPVDVR